MQELVEAGVDRIFLPSILTRSGDDLRFSHSCPYVQAVPYMIKAALSASLLTPEVHLSRGEDVFVAGLAPALAELGVGRHEIAEAYREASAAWAKFRRQIVDAGREVLDGADRAIVVIGKPYNVLDPYLNLNLLKHLRRLGVTAMPMWYLPIEDADLDPPADRLPWQLNRMMVRAVSLLPARRPPLPGPRLELRLRAGRLHPDAAGADARRPAIAGPGVRRTPRRGGTRHARWRPFSTRSTSLAIGRPSWPRPSGRRSRPRWPNRKPLRQSFVIPYFSDHAYAYAGALRAAGHAARVLPLPSEEIRLLGEASTSGQGVPPL